MAFAAGAERPAPPSSCFQKVAIDLPPSLRASARQAVRAGNSVSESSHKPADQTFPLKTENLKLNTPSAGSRGGEDLDDLGQHVAVLLSESVAAAVEVRAVV